MWSTLILGYVAGGFLFGLGASSCSDEFCFNAETGEPVDCAEIFKRQTKEWDCDIRSWTRAPDLMAGHQVPAETRLVLNGTQCGDVEGWEVGLRLKERAIIKMRDYDLPFPIKPVRKPRNATRTKTTRRDWNDIYQGHYGGQIFAGPDEDRDEYQVQMEAYRLAIQNKTLFQVHAHERIVFDTKLALELPKVKDEETISDHVVPFSVMVPLTNLPPMKAEQGGMFGGANGKNEQMLNTETSFEYYHLLRLSNGTTLDIAAGKAGFLTEPSETGLAAFPQNQEMSWPMKTALQSPRNDSAGANNEYGQSLGLRQRGPDCDAYNRAEFEITISAKNTRIVPNQNLTLNIHLQRTGNGSEYPAFIDISLGTFENITYAYEFITNDREYDDLTRSDGSGSPRWPSQGKMLLVRSLEALEKERKKLQETGGSYSMSNNGRWPVTEGTVRYDFEEHLENVGDRDGYDFTIELPIPYNILPGFEQTFSTFVPQVDFRLATTFLCNRGGSAPNPEDLNLTERRDTQWEEWRLPAKKTKGTVAYHGSSNHHGVIPIYISRPSQLSEDLQSHLRHYQDPSARAPRLSKERSSESRPLGLADINNFDFIGIEKRGEEEHELKHSRYGLFTSERQYQPRCLRGSNVGGCWNKNNGGGGMHTAKLWQRSKEESKAMESDYLGNDEQVVYKVAGDE